MSEQRQQLLGLQLAIDLLGQQAVEELHGHGTELLETLTQQQFALAGIVRGMMALDQLTHAGLRAGHEHMAGDLFQADGVNDDFTLGDAHGEHLADVRPRHRVEVQTMADITFDVDVAIEYQGGIQVGTRQRHEVRPFAFIALQRRFLEVAQLTQVGDLRQPPGSRLVEMFQGVEGAAVEEAGFGIVKLAFDLALGLRPTHPAGPGAEAIVRRQGQETRVVDRAVGIVTQHHHLEVVVETDACQAAEMMEGMHVLAQGGRHIHRFDKTQILPA